MFDLYIVLSLYRTQGLVSRHATRWYNLRVAAASVSHNVHGSVAVAASAEVVLSRTLCLVAHL